LSTYEINIHSLNIIAYSKLDKKKGSNS